MRNRVKAILRNAYLQMKGIGILKWIPVIIIYVFIPITYYAIYESDTEMLMPNIISISRSLFPILAIWNEVCTLYHLVEKKGNEIYYVQKKSKLEEVTVGILLFLVLLLPMFIFYVKFYHNLIWLCLAVAVKIICYSSYVYGSSFLVNKISLGVMGIILHTLLCMWLEEDENVYVMYYVEYYDKIQYLQREIYPYLLAGLIFLVLGYFLNVRKQRYN